MLFFVCSVSHPSAKWLKVNKVSLKQSLPTERVGTCNSLIRKLPSFATLSPKPLNPKLPATPRIRLGYLAETGDMGVL